MKSLLGKKIGMSRVFSEDGQVTTVTLVELGPCVVLAQKSQEKDGYQAIRLGYDKRGKEGDDKIKGNQDRSFRFVKEVKTDDEHKAGQEIDLGQFEVGEIVDVISTSKGKGFSGVVKRHGFHGAPKTHGHKHDHRGSGSIGCAFPQHVMKGKKMAGHQGHTRVTVKNLEIVRIDPKKNLMALSGSLPGCRNAYLQVVSRQEKKEAKKD